MKYILIVIMVFPFVYASKCGNHKNAATEQHGQKEVIVEQEKDSIPPCIRQMIVRDKKEESTSLVVQADEYLYNGKKAYLFIYGCCDHFNMLYDDSCKSICAPSGGFTGRGDGKCTDFAQTAKFIKQIWKDSAR